MKNKTRIRISAELLGAAAAFFVMLGVVGMNRIGDVTTALGEVPQIPAFEDRLLSALCSCKPDPKSVDTSEAGEHELKIRYLGVFGKSVTVRVKDMTLPEAEIVGITAVRGTELAASDFVKTAFDQSEVFFTAEGLDTSEAGIRTVSVILTDAGGNRTEYPAQLTVVDPDTLPFAEYGSDAEPAMEELRRMFGLEFLGGTSPGENGIGTDCGSYPLYAETENEKYYLTFSVKDTTPPSAEGLKLDIRKGGEGVKAEDFVTAVTDLSETSVSFAGEPDFDTAGERQVRLLVSDAAGNLTEVETVCRVWDVPEVIRVECGTSRGTLEETVAKYTCGTKTLSLPDQLDCGAMLPGTYDAELTGEYGSLAVSLVFSDTSSPVLRLQDVTVYTGTEVTAEDFVVSCTDNTSAGYAFVTVPDCRTAHTETVGVRAFDSFGNETVETATLTVKKDDIPPEIFGTKTITALVGETISYRKGVYATDNADGDVYVSVDASAVDISTEGTYSVVYRATDNAGNTASVTVSVEIGDINQAMVDRLADQVLADIVSDGMTDRDKCRAIYAWVQSNITYSTATSYLMGQYVEGAYSGFTTFAGNCYIHFAVSKVMFDRLGIENIMVQRDNPEHPHYWNLVKIEGNWYHFDATNRSRTTCLSTDAEIAYYSTYENVGYYSFDTSLYPATP